MREDIFSAKAVESAITLNKQMYGEASKEQIKISRDELLQMQDVLKHEYECICRNCEGCNRDCYHCDLILDADYIKTAYKLMQKLLSFINIVDERL